MIILKNTQSEKRQLHSIISGFMNCVTFISKLLSHCSIKDLLKKKLELLWLCSRVYNMVLDYYIQWCLSSHKNCIRNYQLLRANSNRLLGLLIQFLLMRTTNKWLNISSKFKINSNWSISVQLLSDQLHQVWICHHRSSLKPLLSPIKRFCLSKPIFWRLWVNAKV